MLAIYDVYACPNLQGCGEQRGLSKEPCVCARDLAGKGLELGR